MFDINEFLSEINARGYVKPSNFDVMIFGPNLDGGNDVERVINMRCLSAELPGRQIQTIDYFQYGVPSVMPTLNAFSEISLDIILDEKFKIREYFEKWHDKIGGNHRKQQTSPDMYDLGFYTDYIGTVEITNYNELGDKIRTTKLIEAYPKTIAENALTWQNGTEFMTMRVLFVYRRYINV